MNKTSSNCLVAGSNYPISDLMMTTRNKRNNKQRKDSEKGLHSYTFVCVLVI